MSSTQGYAAEAAALVRQYESITFDDVHGAALHLYPAAPCKVLDVGAGTGRDAAALARRGYQVTAVEPTAELRTAGQPLHADAAISWIDDQLPDLAHVRALQCRFDLILLTAVWMHLDPTERAIGMCALGALAAPGGLVAMTLRHGPVPAGRRMFDISGDETAPLAASQGFAEVHRDRHADGVLGRPDVSWTRLILRAGA